ncbi:MAG: PTS sugar transporter subunit IIA [Sedimentisphaerales bacterium]|nr:PTS sugar transporter subunit IIA [Sedimentisphaerales bacterium]
MKFEDFICFEATIPELGPVDRDGAIEALVNALCKAGRVKTSHIKEIVKLLIGREKEASTGIGKGVAVPHVKHASIEHVVGVVGLSQTGIEFRSLDKQPVFVIILLLSPLDMPDQHIKAMEWVFRHLQHDRFRRFLRQCRTAGEVEELLREADAQPAWLSG